MEPTEPKVTTVADRMVTHPSSIIMKQYAAKYKKFLDRKDKTEENTTKLYSLIWGQCMEAMQVALKGIDDFQAKDDAFDVKWLLENSKFLSSGIKQAMVNICESAHRAGIPFFNFRQK